MFGNNKDKMIVESVSLDWRDKFEEKYPAPEGFHDKYLGKKDSFGHGTERPETAKDKLMMQQTILDQMYANGKVDQDEYKYLYNSIQTALSDIKKYNQLNATFGIGKSTEEAIASGDPRYKLMTMHDKKN